MMHPLGSSFKGSIASYSKTIKSIKTVKRMFKLMIKVRGICLFQLIIRNYYVITDKKCLIASQFIKFLFLFPTAINAQSLSSLKNQLMRVIKYNCSFKFPIAILQKINSQSNNPNIVLDNNINILGVVQIKVFDLLEEKMLYICHSIE